MEGVVTLSDVAKWLREGKDEPETFVDLRWVEIGEVKDDGKVYGLRFTHPKVPVNLLVLDLEIVTGKVPMIRLVVETGVRTIDLRPEDKIRLYRHLLEASKMPFAKFYLFGDEDEVAIAVDLDKRGLTRDELESHLASLLLGYTLLAEHESVKPQMEEKEASTLILLVARWMERGIPRERALKRLLDAGFDREVAEGLIRLVYGPRRESGGLVTIY